ncbi:FAD/NAD(P)-binding domain-containing protein [Macrolepiota fuliginosa MF-IS2]|uniref:Kynurenine 3-monooxygenase n=1 Tax=Macrolepiota fuliginosa MF-IS2 TaxID=1400762 RepID=A0A9P5XMJ3_9AGAR|nr:FAD/NAD(P)-binding domain-containing protein [Macrolepiota fuliginosa MF-IS2]
MPALLERPRKAVIIGAGPVGCLAALALAKHGWNVEVYEGRPDLRLPSSKALSQQRSINLAISHRGIAALEAVNPAAAQRFLKDAIPMRGRMIHTLSGKPDSQKYDRDGQCINSIDRALLNEGLLDEASASSKIRILFNHKVTAVDFDHRFITVRDSTSGLDSKVDFDFCIGADGSYSVTRRQLMRVVRMDYNQEYIKDEYIELKMPAGRDVDGQPVFFLDPNHLHIWPRHSFMLIALPNRDKTFTCTLFAPSSVLDGICTPEAVISWFNRYFPDALRAIGEKNLVNDFLRNPRSPLICTKVRSMPYHYKDRAILLGDAAHSMVPFYGQGLNCGLEDVRILSALLAQEGVASTTTEDTATSINDVDGRLASALRCYSENRHQDLVAICDLAMDNYVEMRHSVTTLGYLLRKALDNILYTISAPRPVSLPSLALLLARVPFTTVEPTGWLPLYTMVTFRPDISYATARRKAARQAYILTGLHYAGVSLLGVAATSLVYSILIRYMKSSK